MALIDNYIKIFSKMTKNLQKMLPERFQNGPKWDPDGLWNPFGVRERVRKQFLQFDSAIFGAKIGPKLVKNRPKIEKIPIPKPTLNSIPFFDRFLIKF